MIISRLVFKKLSGWTRDWILIGFGVLLLLVSLVILFFGYGGFWVPEALIKLVVG